MENFGRSTIRILSALVSSLMEFVFIQEGTQMAFDCISRKNKLVTLECVNNLIYIRSVRLDTISPIVHGGNKTRSSLLLFPREFSAST